jgi:hypothetical protein
MSVSLRSVAALFAGVKAVSGAGRGKAMKRA